MELRQLEYFVAVVDHGTFTRAAEQERVAQPAVSAQIQRLERQVGQPLFDRSRRAVRLTSAGAALLPHARAALSAVQAGVAAVDDVARVVRGTLAIGTVTSHSVDIARLLADFHADFPDVEISLGTDTSDVLLDKVRDGRLGIVIASIGVTEAPDGLDVAVITDEAIEAAVATGHALARRVTLPLATLCEYPVISLPRGTGLRTAIDAACGRLGLGLRVAFEASSPLALADLAERGLGVAVLPESVTRGRSGLQPLVLAPALRGRLVWAWRRDGVSPAARVFCERARVRGVGATA